MDEISIFRNPTNINYYPNMLLGSLGKYVSDPALDTAAYTQWSALARYNRDPEKPYFGGILSYSLNNSSDVGKQYPMLSIGAVFNRHDYLVDYVAGTNADVRQAFSLDSGMVFLAPVGKIDFLLGYVLPNGGMIGGGAYFAFQSDKGVKGADMRSNVTRGNVGINWPIAKSVDMEASVGVAFLTAVGEDTAASTKKTVAENEPSFRGEVRFFSALSSLNGDLVPRVAVEKITIGNDLNNLSIEGGLGININIDRGFWWGGIEALYSQREIGANDSTGIGARIGFGIERNAVWDWLVLRTGVMKRLMYITDGEKGRWIQNPEATGTDDDHIGGGIGINIENRLKIDLVMAEDVLYTFTNLFSGPHHHLFTRLNATYSF